MRRRRPERRQILPDPVYNDKLVAKFVNYIMDKGKKGIAEKIFYGAMNNIKQRTKTDGLKIFEKAIENVSPSVEVKSGKPMSEKLASELISAANGEGGAVKKKDDTHRMADANKAFAHFR